MRTLVVLAVIFVLLHLAGTTDFLSLLTRPVVIGLLNSFGSAALDDGGDLVLGRLHVPWTRDCAGLNILIVLWAVTLWANRTEPLSRLYWLRLAAVPVAAFVANVFRILSLLAYRYASYPSVESPQLHYFIGFLWVMPLLPLLVPRAGRNLGRYFVETLFLVTALSLASPFVQAPGGSIVTVATLLLLAKSQYVPVLLPGRRLLAVGWVAAAAGIALACMESLWLPWLLLCPWFVPRGFGRAFASWGLALGTIPLVAMHPVARYLVVVAAGVEIWTLMRSSATGSQAAPATSAAPPASAFLVCAGLVLLFLAPFIASTLSGLLRPSLRPPAGVMAREVAPNAFELHLIGQPGNVSLVWYGPSGDGRHHTLTVCMRYRGIVLRPSGVEPAVFTDGKVWMREFFLQDGRLLTDYRAYLRNTLVPWSSAGVHLIVSAPADSVSAQAFASSAFELAAQLSQLNATSLAAAPPRLPRQAT